MIKESKVTTWMGLIKAIADAIKELKEVPSGHLYARLMGKLSLDQYNTVIEILTDAKWIKVEYHLITWIKD